MNVLYLYCIVNIEIACAISCFCQTVSNVQFVMANNQVQITYLLDQPAEIAIFISEDGGMTWSMPLMQVSGDVGQKVAAGKKQIVWDALSEYEQIVGTNIRFKVQPVVRNDLEFYIGGYKFVMKYVQGGTFVMGATSEKGNEIYKNEQPAHEVRLNDYWIGEYEVPQWLWKKVMANNPSSYRDLDSPVESVSWEECMEFIGKLNEQLAKQLKGKRFALPTEAQWEYAARGGSKSNGYKYAGSDSVDYVAWYDKNMCDRANPRPVGHKLPNELGLHDMSGNVWEWCLDWYGVYLENIQINPQGVVSGEKRIRRGGSYGHPAKSCRVSCRGSSNPLGRYRNVGLRLVLLP